MNKASQSSARASIGKGTRVVGRITGDGDLLVEGRAEGEITLSGHLTVGRGGVVAAPLVVGELTIEGAVEGDVSSRGAVTLKNESRLRGAIKASKLALEDGARFSGRIEMDVELPSELASNRRG